MRRTALLLAAGAAAALVLAGAVVPFSAYAWKVERYDAAALLISREASDAPGTVYVYQTGTSPNTSQLADGSWCETGTGNPWPATPSYSILFDDTARTYQLTGQNLFLVVTPDGARVFNNQRVNYSTPVYMAGSGTNTTLSTWTVNAAVVGTVPVTQEASVSVEGTLPVTLADVPPEVQSFTLYGGLVFAGWSVGTLVLSGFAQKVRSGV